jgi:hypothetical protein
MSRSPTFLPWFQYRKGTALPQSLHRSMIPVQLVKKYDLGRPGPPGPPWPPIGFPAAFCKTKPLIWVSRPHCDLNLESWLVTYYDLPRSIISSLRKKMQQCLRTKITDPIANSTGLSSYTCPTAPYYKNRSDQHSI